MELIEILIEEVFGMVIDGISLLFSEGIPFLWKFLNIILWAMAGVILLPMVFVSGNIYPMWEKWAENLKS